MKIIHNCFGYLKKYIEPKSQNEDSSRKEFIFNILLVPVLFMLAVASINNTVRFLGDPTRYENSTLSVLATFLIFLFFILLLFLSRKGFFRLASYLLLSTLFSLIIYMMLQWGVDVNAGLLLSALVIVISGILISTRFAFITTITIAFTMIALDYLQKSQIVRMSRYWRDEPWTQIDSVMVIIIFLVIATVSWLSNREIEKALARARKSEAELKEERDSLEITVEKRTKELMEEQAEKMTQLYRFAEFGRISSSMFHDLINPLNAVSLNVEKLKNRIVGGMPSEAALSAEASAQALDCVARAVSAAKRMEHLVAVVRKQLAREENKANFSLKEEIEGVISMLSHKAQKAGVTMRFLCKNDIALFGDAMRFNQIALNLITNAIDSYQDASIGQNKREVIISLHKKDDTAIVSVKDEGVGVSEECKYKIFEPFFTTKPEKYPPADGAMGIGLGLSITKRFTEKDFGGDITVVTKKGEGSEFIVHIPIAQAGMPAAVLENK